MNPVQFAILLFYIVSSNNVLSRPRRHEIDDKLTVDREVAFYCYKQKICTPGGEKVCGYDPLTPWLAVFADLCTLYKANCKKFGMFHLVAKIVCDTRIEYDKEHVNETFEYIHLISTTEKTQLVTQEIKDWNKRIQDNFPAFHCYKKRICTPGGPPVCGIDLENNITAEFMDLCTLHGVNCFKQGRFYLLETKACNASLFFGKVVTGAYGLTAQAYETYTPSTIPITTEITTEEDTSSSLTVVKIETNNIARFVSGFIDFLSSNL